VAPEWQAQSASSHMQHCIDAVVLDLSNLICTGDGDRLLAFPDDHPEGPLNMGQGYLIHSSSVCPGPSLLSVVLWSSWNWGSRISATRLSCSFTEQIAAARRVSPSACQFDANPVLLANSGIWSTMSVRLRMIVAWFGVFEFLFEKPRYHTLTRLEVRQAFRCFFQSVYERRQGQTSCTRPGCR
jgi:hypothetical protein